MKILQIIHGYPIRFNAGSEIYTQMLVHGLVKDGNEVVIFTREEDPFKPDYTLIKEFEEVFNKNKQIFTVTKYLLNVARQKDRYVSSGVDERLEEVLEDFKPDIAHIQHLNHLSITLLSVLKARNIPIVFTLHDFWLACPRGQFLQINYGESSAHKLCDGQENEKCAEHCYSRFYTGIRDFQGNDVKYWIDWVDQRQKLIKNVLDYVSVFISPSKYLMKRMIQELDVLSNKTIYLDYGFDLERYNNRNREFEEKIVFGYIGTHIIAKGVDLLIKSFSKVKHPSLLRIWGRSRGETTPYLETLINGLSLPDYLQIEFKPEYENSNIIRDVFNNTDVIVVPSIWGENSPLVIHEALQSRLPVITANYGGMVEYVQHQKNGLLFEHRNEESLTEQMEYFIENKEVMNDLAKIGYLQSNNGDIVSIEDHVSEIMKVYESAIGDS